MTTVLDHDWKLLNAYADGELTPEVEAQVAERLRGEPQLVAALEEIRETKSDLALLRPPVTSDHAHGRPPRTPRLALPLTLAAAFVAGAIFVSQFMSQDWRNAPSELHAKFSANSYVLPEEINLPVISTASSNTISAFDLSSSRLTLVDVQISRQARRETVAMHYRGRNGCRVTVVAMEASAKDPLPQSGEIKGLAETWSVEGLHFFLLASGMDTNRFQAIAAFAKAESFRLTGRDRLRMAMRETTDQAKPCA
ncbi:hypothetical protein O2N63_17080 [Aliiroseovarius sp. KMU-50]|uniref:Anti-sigma factor n=1 Tax=Aliiroseovarius salicola TaxID=3009082 RepID=A0ABT4W718_9RHOB|nr:hypothetical protein [Aliiroseovarius sp. KMU-50]MDA5095807.1 hypothetical protein [Aliiroseovarius sp. KMU-50]